MPRTLAATLARKAYRTRRAGSCDAKFSRQTPHEVRVRRPLFAAKTVVEMGDVQPLSRVGSTQGQQSVQHSQRVGPTRHAEHQGLFKQ
jgi:hypothetical protein